MVESQASRSQPMGRVGQLSRRLSRASLLANRTVDRAARLACITFFVAMCAATFSQVVARYFLSTSIIWASDVALACFVWMAFVGAGVAVNERTHFTVDILSGLTSRFPFTERLLMLLEHLIVGAVGVLLLVTGLDFTQASMDKRSFAVGVDIGYFTAAIPVAGAMIVVGTIHHVLLMLAGHEDPRHDPSTHEISGK